MLTDPIVQQLHRLRLPAMAAALEQLLANAQHSPLTFEERLSLMIQHEISERDSKRLAQRLRWAKLPQPAVLEDLDIRTPRGLDPKVIAMLATLGWVRDRLNVLVTGPCGVGKSYIASALAHAACRADYSVRSYRLPRLVDELTRHHAQATRSALLRQLAKVDLLYIDDFGLTSRRPDQARPARNPRRPIRQEIHAHHQPTPRRPVVHVHRRTDAGRCHPRPPRAQQPPRQPQGRIDAKAQEHHRRRGDALSHPATLSP